LATCKVISITFATKPGEFLHRQGKQHTQIRLPAVKRAAHSLSDPAKNSSTPQTSDPFCLHAATDNQFLSIFILVALYSGLKLSIQAAIEQARWKKAGEKGIEFC